MTASTPLKDPPLHTHSLGRIILENSGVAEPQNIRDQFNDAIAEGHPLMQRCHLDTLITGTAGRSWWVERQRMRAAHVPLGPVFRRAGQGHVLLLGPRSFPLTPNLEFWGLTDPCVPLLPPYQSWTPAPSSMTTPVEPHSCRDPIWGRAAGYAPW